jgi:deoxyguanosine kinase
MYLIEGNIGAGKSTFLQLVKNSLPDLEVVFEPVNVWHTADHGKSLLQNFYTDTKRWAYTMESFTLINRTFENSKMIPGSQPIAERSIYSGYYCFAKNSHENGFMDRLEWNIYEKWFQFLTNHHSYTPPKGFVYLRTTPSIAYDRILKRSRSAESLISFGYINQIHQRHEDLLLNNNRTELHTGAPVLVLDANVNFEENPAAFKEMLCQLQAFMR